jgi:hypothetical protein
MRKLTTLCCLLAVIGVSFFACQKNDRITPNSVSVSTTTSLSKQVIAFENQKVDYQYLSSKKEIDTIIRPDSTYHNTARFVLTYFDIFEEEKEKSYTPNKLKSALLEAGLSVQEAQKRTHRIFSTMDCSPTYLAETGTLLSPILPLHTEGVFICELFKPYDASQEEKFSDITSGNNGVKVLFKKNNGNEHVKQVNRLLGVCGSIAAYGGNRIELVFRSIENDSLINYLLNYRDVRFVLQETRGYTEGDVMYLKLILGELTEEEVWLLFETEILPELQKTEEVNFEQTFGYQLNRLYFRYNYIEITGSTGRLGYTIYDLEGFTETEGMF